VGGPPAWFDLEVLRVVQETPRDRTVVLGVPAALRETFRFAPGQFVVLRDRAWSDRLQRPYSLSSAPDQADSLDVTVRDEGRFGRHLYERAPGDRLEARPPQGHFVLEVPTGFSLVLVSGGAGVTPFRGFLRHLRHEAHADPVVLLASARVPEDLVFHAEFEAHARESTWFRYEPTVTRAAPEDPWTGRRGRVDADLIAAAVPDPQRTVLYACGPSVFVDAVEHLATVRGVPKPLVRRERWG
jgi:ferredoxin-NADP reductase